MVPVSEIHKAEAQVHPEAVELPRKGRQEQFSLWGSAVIRAEIPSECCTRTVTSPNTTATPRRAHVPARFRYPEAAGNAAQLVLLRFYCSDRWEGPT